MHKVIGVCLLLLAVSCGDEEKDVCSRHDVDGVYMVTTTEVSGTCGDIGDFVVRVDNGARAEEEGCVIEHESYSDDDCKSSAEITCVDVANDLRTTAVIAAEQEPGGDKVSGVMTMTAETLVGVAVCVSTYDVRYVRQ